MQSEIERRKYENDLIRSETRLTLYISLGIVFSIFFFGFISFKLHRGDFPTTQVKTIWQMVNIIAVVLVAVVLAVRRTIYFSARLLKGEVKLRLILEKWRMIDLVLLSFGELLAILGLVMSFIGMPWKNTYHFFIAAFLITLILMPIPWKVKDKIRYYEKFAGKWNE